MKSLKILFAASEVTPYSQSGGLGDVAGSLPKALAALGHEVYVFSPMYRGVSQGYRHLCKDLGHFHVNLSWRSQYCGLFELIADDVHYIFIDNLYYFGRDNVYGYGDDIERFAFFSKAVIDSADHLGVRFDVMHANDWHTGMIPVYLHTLYADHSAKSVFTIHNIGYQGQCDSYRLGDLFGLGVEHLPLLEYEGCINIMKGAIVCCDALTTVSPTYAQEIKTTEYSYGLHNIINANSGKLTGLINGIDNVFYNPATDTVLAANFNRKDMKGKALDKAALQKQFSLEENPSLPLFVMVTRLVDHKGLDLVTAAFGRLMEMQCQFAVLGSGDAIYQDFFNDMQAQHPGHFGIYVGFNPDLAKQMYAGGDFFLMPSRYEPCGLAQLIAMRYATIPIVRKTGGLADTVSDCRLGTGNGIVFEGYNDTELLDAVSLALELYARDKDFAKLRNYTINCDFSWKRSAGEYVKLYQSL